jgi:hypothetical protein
MQKRYNQEAPDTYISNGINGLPNVIAKTFSVTPAISGKDYWNLTVGKDGDLNLGTFGEWTITALDTFSATVKMWGAGGARGYDHTQSITSTAKQGNAGSAGYSTATITFRRGQKYILQVGQGGARTTTVTDGATYLKGGVGVAFGGTEGGGYTGIFYDSVSQGNVMLIAGGGGSGGNTDFTGTGGAGGGITAGDAGNTSQGGFGGTLLAGGAATSGNGPTAGSALRGGSGQKNNASAASLGGGGGGYFGGGGGNVGGGGGGSGRIGLFADVTAGTTTAGSGNTVANSADADRAGSGQGGNATIGNTGSNGRLLIRL